MVVKGDCPHCGTRSVALTITNSVRSERNGRVYTDSLVVCGQCGRCILAMIPGRLRSEQHIYELGWALAPPLPDPGAPAHTPEHVGRFFEQGMEILNRNFDAAGTMFRKTLEAALKLRFPELNGNLVQRIDKAAKNGALTQHMAEWAHQIRRLGNEAAHEEEPFSEQDATDLRSFTDLLLRYLFTLPGMLEEAQRKPGDHEAQV